MVKSNLDGTSDYAKLKEKYDSKKVSYTQVVKYIEDLVNKNESFDIMVTKIQARLFELYDKFSKNNLLPSDFIDAITFMNSFKD